MRVLDLEGLPHEEEYETLAGFLMVMLRRVPRRTDSVNWGGYKFEVMDVDSYRIDQVLVLKLDPDAPAPYASTTGSAGTQPIPDSPAALLRIKMETPPDQGPIVP